MKSIMNDLYYGRINPWECRTSHTDEYKELDCKRERNEQYFIEKMSGEDYQRVEDYQDILWQMHSIEKVDMFSYGFKLGSLFMIEVFSDENGSQRNVH